MNIFSARFELVLATVTVALAGYLAQTVYPDFEGVSMASLLSDASEPADVARPAVPPRHSDADERAGDGVNRHGRLSCESRSEEPRADCGRMA